ncbi:hypothetical protein [Desulfosarcina cetonica]
MKETLGKKRFNTIVGPERRSFSVFVQFNSLAHKRQRTNRNDRAKSRQVGLNYRKKSEYHRKETHPPLVLRGICLADDYILMIRRDS